jgi:hypothetical protein
MTPLDTAFRSDKFDFIQIAREGDVALFRKSKVRRIHLRNLRGRDRSEDGRTSMAERRHHTRP